MLILSENWKKNRPGHRRRVIFSSWEKPHNYLIREILLRKKERLIFPKVFKFLDNLQQLFWKNNRQQSEILKRGLQKLNYTAMQQQRFKF